MQNVLKPALPSIALHDPWCLLIFGLWWVSLVEYIPVLRVNTTCCRWYHVSWLLQELFLSHHGRGMRPMDKTFSSSFSICFCWKWSWNLHVSKPCVWWFQNYVASATKFVLCVVIILFVLQCMLNYFELYVTCDMYVESCTILVCMLVMIRGPSWHWMDYWVYMGSSMIARLLWWLILYLCSYKMVGSMIAPVLSCLV